MKYEVDGQYSDEEVLFIIEYGHNLSQVMRKITLSLMCP